MLLKWPYPRTFSSSCGYVYSAPVGFVVLFLVRRPVLVCTRRRPTPRILQRFGAGRHIGNQRSLPQLQIEEKNSRTAEKWCVRYARWPKLPHVFLLLSFGPEGGDICVLPTLRESPRARFRHLIVVVETARMAAALRSHPRRFLRHGCSLLACWGRRVRNSGNKICWCVRVCSCNL